MWVLVFFDLPTETKKERSIAAKFRQSLIKDGFDMFQFSIYTRFCASKENAVVHSNRVKNKLPKKGKIGILKITDRQFGLMDLFIGTKPSALENAINQLELLVMFEH